MAVIVNFEPDDRKLRGLHPTQVSAKILVEPVDGKKVVQINTYGSDEREMPDKLSQTIQLTEKSARQLWEILGREFGFR